MLIEIDIPDVVPAELLDVLDAESVQIVLADIAASAYNHWLGLANKYLHTSLADYTRALQEVQLMPGVAVIALVGQPANMIENGADIVDLRDWLLGPRVPEGPGGKRRAKDGHFYRSIPFRHQTPGTEGTQAPAMGDPYRGVVAGARDLGQDVYKKAQKLAATTAKTLQRPRGEGRYPGRLPPGTMPKLKEHHKTDIYDGMIRQEAAYKEGVQTTYSTFRTISEAVPEGWIRPPTNPRHFAKRTQDFIARMAPKAFQAFVGQIGG